MWGAIAGAVVGGLMSKSGAESQNDAAAQLSQAQMDWQERMSNTAHQREVEDLRAASLNPILSSKYGGASTPGGSVAPVVNELEPAVSSAQQVARSIADIKQVKENTNLAKQQQYKLESGEHLDHANAMKVNMDSLKTLQETKNLKLQSEVISASAKGLQYDLSKRRTQSQLENIKFGEYTRYLDRFMNSLSPFRSSAKRR